MSLHLAARPGDIAETVLLAGDPLRARYVAETWLEEVESYNEVRAMYGFTGRYQGKRISVQGSGMGMPSTAIYAEELLKEYGVKRLIRVGSCGSLQAEIGLNAVVLAMSASTDSAMVTRQFGGMHYAPTADFGLLHRAYQLAAAQQLPVHVGNILSSDFFYQPDPESWRHWATYGVLAVEMETAVLYPLAARYGAQALTMLTVSDTLVDGGALGAEERERSFAAMMKLALAVGTDAAG